MGNILANPYVDKFNESGDGSKAGENFNYYVANMQGWRDFMEDAHNIVISLKDYPPFIEWSFFSIFDGHSGENASKYAAKCLLEVIMKTREFREISFELKKINTINNKVKELIKDGLINGFMKFDSEMRKYSNVAKEKSGTTAICALVTPQYIFFANLGDSRGLLSRSNDDIFGTKDHKPYLENERDRIEKAGGSVLFQRVNGCLAVSRTFGDFDYKNIPNLPENKQLVIPEPEIYSVKRDPSLDEFMVLACDGVFDVIKNNQLCQLIRSRLTATPDLCEAANQILDVCLSMGSRDNMSIILVVFKSAPKFDPKVYAEDKKWSERIEEEIKIIIKDIEKYDEPKCELVSKYLKDNEKEFESPLPGGIHLTRSIIHRLIEKKPFELPFKES